MFGTINLSGQESMVGELAGPRGKPNTIILLNRDLKLLSKFVSLPL